MISVKLENIILIFFMKKKSQLQKDKHYMISLIWGTQWNKIFRNRK